MRKIFTSLALLSVIAGHAQFSSGDVSLGATGMTVKLETDTTKATLTLRGNSNVYLAIGFGSIGMANGSDGFIYNGQSTLDYTFTGLGMTPTADAVQNWTLVSNTVASGIRTIVATRTLAGGPGDFAFTNAAGNIAITYAKGTSLSLNNHGSNRGFSTLAMAGTLSTDNPEMANKIKAYPNPVSDLLNFSDTNKIVNVTFFDTAGRNLKSIQVNGNTSVDVFFLKVGNYFIEYVYTDGSHGFDKIVKK